MDFKFAPVGALPEAPEKIARRAANGSEYWKL
jgi:hypothetical protein